MRWHRRGEIEVEFVDFGDAAALRAALSKPAAMLWIETPEQSAAAPHRYRRAAAALGKAAGALVVVDNTFLSPAWQQPLALGRGPGGAFDHQVHQRPQRCGRRRGDRGTRELHEQLVLVGELPRAHRRGIR